VAWRDNCRKAQLRHTRRAVASFLGAQDAELRAEFFLQAAEPLEKGVYNRRSYGGRRRACALRRA